MEWQGRRGIRTRLVRVGRARPGRAARGTRGRSLAKEWVGSNRARQERLQLPAATTTEPGGQDLRPQRTADRPTCENWTRVRPALPLRNNPTGNALDLTSTFRNGPIARGRTD